MDVIHRFYKKAASKATKMTKTKKTHMRRIFSCPAVSHQFEKTSYMLREKQTRKKRRQARKKTSCYIKKKDPPCPNLPPIPKVSPTPYVRSCVCVSLLVP
jgi:hypothetical protein